MNIITEILLTMILIMVVTNSSIIPGWVLWILYIVIKAIGMISSLIGYMDKRRQQLELNQALNPPAPGGQ